MTITSSDIERLLADRHTKDVFVPQCKDGPSWGGGLCILDAWAMKKSWAHPLTTGYEIKVSRQDFLRDAKWPEYLGYCNEFYFVCPPELIQPSELPPEVGLLWTSKNVKMLYLKKKSPYRKVNVPDELYRYILMSRAKIVPSAMRYPVDDCCKAEYWRAFIADKSAKLEVGRISSRKIRKLLQEKVADVDALNARLSREIESLREAEAFLDKTGIQWRRWFSEHQAKAKIMEITTGVSKDFIGQIDSVLRGLGKIRKNVRQHGGF